jgi:hypothetical protein
MRRVRIFLAYGSVVRAAGDAAADQALRRQMIAGRGYRYRRCRGEVVEKDGTRWLDLSASVADETRTDSTAVPFAYDRLSDKFVLEAEWATRCDALVLDGVAITNLEIEIGSIDAIVWAKPGLQQVLLKTIEQYVGGPVVEADAEPPPADPAKPRRGPKDTPGVLAEQAMLRQLRLQGPERLTPDDLRRKAKKNMAAWPPRGCRATRPS